jgi:Concanavalin A-like lectin/glucanases superfamily
MNRQSQCLAAGVKSGLRMGLLMPALLVVAGPAVRAQAVSVASQSNHVLELDGDGSYVEMPPNIFSGVDEATVEAWVNWGSFQSMSRVFDCVFNDKPVSLHNRGNGSDLWVEMFASGERRSLQATDMLRANEWVHLAVVVGPDEMKLFFNGALLSDRLVRAPDTFRSAEFTRNNFLGRSNAKVIWEQDGDFDGQIDEVRAWRGKRTEAQIRETMFQALSGREQGLLAGSSGMPGSQRRSFRGRQIWPVWTPCSNFRARTASSNSRLMSSTT